MTDVKDLIKKPSYGDTFYHGTHNPEKIKKTGFSVDNSTPAAHGRGVYITNNLERAKEYGTPIKVTGHEKLNFYKPTVQQYRKEFGSNKFKSPEEASKHYGAQGYHGVMIKSSNNDTDAVVFNPKHVKAVL